MSYHPSLLVLILFSCFSASLIVVWLACFLPLPTWLMTLNKLVIFPFYPVLAVQYPWAAVARGQDGNGNPQEDDPGVRHGGCHATPLTITAVREDKVLMRHDVVAKVSVTTQELEVTRPDGVGHVAPRHGPS